MTPDSPSWFVELLSRAREAMALRLADAAEALAREARDRAVRELGTLSPAAREAHELLVASCIMGDRHDDALVAIRESLKALSGAVDVMPSDAFSEAQSASKLLLSLGAHSEAHSVHARLMESETSCCAPDWRVIGWHLYALAGIDYAQRDLASTELHLTRLLQLAETHALPDLSMAARSFLEMMWRIEPMEGAI